MSRETKQMNEYEFLNADTFNNSPQKHVCGDDIWHTSKNVEDYVMNLMSYIKRQPEKSGTYSIFEEYQTR